MSRFKLNALLMRDQEQGLPLKFACSAAIVAMLAISGSAEARPKRPQLMNSCSCACRQETATTVYIANKDFYSSASCGSFSGTSCNVQVTTSSGSYTVNGKWEGCVSNGQAWVRVQELIGGVRPSLTVDPRNIAAPPTR
jgi:hypothetical protein